MSDIDVKKSKFQFTNPRIKKIVFEINSSFDNTKYTGIGTSISTKISNRENNSANVELCLFLGKNKDSVPFNLELAVDSSFRWDDDLSEDLISELLNRNAKVFLLSYLRPFVTHLIVDAGYPPLVLPFYDFSDEGTKADS